MKIDYLNYNKINWYLLVKQTQILNVSDLTYVTCQTSDFLNNPNK